MKGRSRFFRRHSLWLVVVGLQILAPNLAAQRPLPFIDTHAHPAESIGEATPDGFMKTALRVMAANGIEKTIILPPPTAPGRGQGWRNRFHNFVNPIKGHPNSFAFAAGGEFLNPLIQSTPSNSVTPAIRREFENVAEKLVASGISAFGEFAAQTFFVGPFPYMPAPPDHQLYFLLADIAAKHGLPIDLHMEAIANDGPMPSLGARRDRRAEAERRNPANLTANISLLERLLAYNRKATIIWAHAGWDNTGARTVELMRRLLVSHPNLYMSIKFDSRVPGKTPIMDSDRIRADWLELLHDFRDRFVIGSDQFYDEEPALRINFVRPFITALPPELALAIGRENALRIYRLRQ
jgi:predicted TIM-barrel fold metal-dependent hydrolase